MGDGYLVEVEDEVELTDITEVLVQNFYERMDEFEDDELVIVLIDDGDQVEAGVAFVDDLVVLVVDEIAHSGFAGDDQLIDLRCYGRGLLPSRTAASPVAIGCSSTTSSTEIFHAD